MSGPPDGDDARALVLEPVNPAHADAVEELFSDPDILRHTRIPEPLPDGFVARWVDLMQEGRADGTSYGFALLLDGDLVGIGVAPRVEPATATAELGYLVAARARGRGVATEALRRMSDWAFDDLGMERVYLLITVDNEPSKRVAAKCGYRREGVLRSVYLKAGRRVDTESWSLLAGDPR